MQTKLSNLARQPNRSFASALLAFSLFRFLHRVSRTQRTLGICVNLVKSTRPPTGAIAAETFLCHENLV